jgi:hypothetical protein
MDCRFPTAAVVLLLATGCAAPQQQSESAKPPAPAYFKVDPATAGRLIGKAIFRGRLPARKTVTMDADPDCERLHQRPTRDESEIVNGDGGLANVFIYIQTGLEGKQFEPPSQAATIDQKGCWFRPRVLGLQTRQKLRVSNSDPVSHNIHPLAQVNREWNQNQSPDTPPIERSFTRSERMIPVKCNIHAWMRAWIGVVDHPYFAVTDPTGSFDIASLPPGQYTVEAWHETFGTQQQSITVPRSGTVNASFTFIGSK